MKNYHLLFIFLLFFGQISAQSLISSHTFDDGLDGWTVQAGWEWSDNGEADNGDGFWADRSAIQSDSGPGAIVFKNPDINFGTISSPIINLGGQSTIFLKFNQYYRNLQALTQLRVTNTDNGVSESFNLNENVLSQVETSASDVQTIDISGLLSVAGANTNIQLTFLFEGNRYFWLIDDVEFWDDVPPPPVTNPIGLGDSLTAYGYPFGVHKSEIPGDGNMATPYVPNEMVVQFSPLATELERELIRDTFGVIDYTSCVCDTLELWTVGDGIIVDDNGVPVPDVGSIGLLERVIGAGTNSKIDGADLNYYNVSQYEMNLPPNPTMIDEGTVVNIPVAPADAIRIAVLDTGLDYLHEPGEESGLNGFIYQKGSTDCYDNDLIGWNFVHDVNNPMDDHSHGTHVAGIIAQNIRDNGPHDCNFHIIPIKTHDYQGVSTLFQATCGTYLAIKYDVSVINDSWGFYGEGSTILENATSAALDHNILIVSAAGNDMVYLDDLNQYPACYTIDNILTVGSVDNMLGFSNFSNFSPFWVDILAPGEDILSTVPPLFSDPTELYGFARKSGTSMSTPAVTAAAAIAYCQYSDYSHVKNRVLDCANNESSLAPFAVGGRVLNFNIECLTTATEEIPLASTDVFTIFPNPTNGELSLVPKETLEAVKLTILSVEGKEMMQQQIDQWYKGQEENLNLASLPAGMYFLHIQQENSSWVSRIVKL